MKNHKISNKISMCEYFVIEEETLIRLLTFVWFTPEECEEHQLVEVNSFDKATREWKHDRFKIDKFTNYHGCQLKFLIGQEGHKFIMKEMNDDQVTVKKCEGYFCSIVNDFSAPLNYTFEIILRDDDHLQNFEKYLSRFLVQLANNLLSAFQRFNDEYPENGKLFMTRPVHFF